MVSGRAIFVPSLVILVSAVQVLSCKQTDRITNRIAEADVDYIYLRDYRRVSISNVTAV